MLLRGKERERETHGIGVGGMMPQLESNPQHLATHTHTYFYIQVTMRANKCSLSVKRLDFSKCRVL